MTVKVKDKLDEEELFSLTKEHQPIKGDPLTCLTLKISIIFEPLPTIYSSQSRLWSLSFLVFKVYLGICFTSPWSPLFLSGKNRTSEGEADT